MTKACGVGLARVKHTVKTGKCNSNNKSIDKNMMVV